MRLTLGNYRKTVVVETGLKGGRVQARIKVFSKHSKVTPRPVEELLYLRLVCHTYPRMKIMLSHPGPRSALVAVKQALAYQFQGTSYRCVCHNEHVGVRYRIRVWVPAHRRRHSGWWTSGSILRNRVLWDGGTGRR